MSNLAHSFPLPLLLLAVLHGACSPTESAPEAGTPEPDGALPTPDGSMPDTSMPLDTGASLDAGEDPWQPVRDVLEASDIDNFTLLVGGPSGELFVHEQGDSTADRVYELASGSKWPAAATIMLLVEEGVLSLDDRVRDLVPWWSSDESDPRSRITLRHLLSFTSGFAAGALDIPCVEDPDTTLEQCAREIHDGFHRYEPGEVFYYGPPHLQVAGMMAEYATGQSWVEIYAERLTGPLGMDNTRYLTASETNPRVAGGAASTAREYGTFLSALLSGDLLAASADTMRADYTGAGVTIEFSPIPSGVGQEWHYAFGSWRECLSDTWQAPCDEPGSLSSAGLYGWYPWMDVERGYWGVLAMRLRLGVDGRPTVRAIELGLAARPHIEAALSR